MRITINNNEIQALEGESILDAALHAGIYIPHLCKHPDLEPIGGCRLCSVEIEGIDDIVPSCKTLAKEGMKIRVHSPRADKVRKIAMELILATHPADCTGCPKYGKCELQSLYQYLGVGPERWRKKSRAVANDDSNPLIQHLFTRCVRCGRCIRACRELRGANILDYQKTKIGVRAGVESDMPLKEAGCKFCGACIEVCPTGSIMDSIGIIKEDIPYSHSVVPCKSSCPAGIDIPRYVRFIKSGDFSSATAVIRESVPFPEVLGSVCTHACEDVCKRNELGKPISICRLKRAAAVCDDGLWKDKSRMELTTGKKIAVIGSGPTGLTAAYYLAKKGHNVTVYEKNEKVGGQCRYGIPAYRLPDNVLDKEVNTILEVGINLETNRKISNPKNLLKEGFDAVLIAVGTNKGIALPLEGHQLNGVLINSEFLKSARQGKSMELGKKVMVMGGGNVAFDCARTAIRLGAKEVHIACLENEQQMPASIEEITEGREEGIIIHDSCTYLRILGTDSVTGVELQKIKGFYFEQGEAVVDLIEGSEQLIHVDNVIFSVGQKPEGIEEMGVGLIRNVYIETDNDCQTNIPSVFAAGDVVTGTKSVIEAICAGRKSAESIDKYLGGDGDISEILLETETENPYIGTGKGFADLERVESELLEAENRIRGFECIEMPFSSDAAKNEASRCLQCDLRLNLTRPKLWNEYKEVEKCKNS